MGLWIHSTWAISLQGDSASACRMKNALLIVLPELREDLGDAGADHEQIGKKADDVCSLGS